MGCTSSSWVATWACSQCGAPITAGLSSCRPPLVRARAAAQSLPTARSAFGQALTTNLLNPKAVLFFAAVLPQFVDTRGAAPVWVQVGVLGAVDVALGVVAWAAVVLVGLRLARVLQSAVVRRWWDRTTGLLLGGVGGAMLVSAD